MERLNNLEKAVRGKLYDYKTGQKKVEKNKKKIGLLIVLIIMLVGILFYLAFLKREPHL